MKRLALLWVLLTAIPVHAEVFRNAYLSFELPDRWKCVLEGTEWVCRSQLEEEKKQAIIILTAKEVGPRDDLRSYQDHLRQTRTLNTRTGAKIQSRVYHSKAVRINDQLWVDGFHLGSEIPSYYTRYLATVKDKIAILVTFSAHKLHYTKYSNDFFKSIRSLRAIASPELLKATAGSGGSPTGQFGSDLNVDLPAGFGHDEFGTMVAPESSSSSPFRWIALIVLLGAMGGYFYLKKTQKPPRR